MAKKKTLAEQPLAAKIAAELQANGYKYYACDVPHDGHCENCSAIMSAIIDRVISREPKAEARTK